MTISSLPGEVVGGHIFARLSVSEVRSFLCASKDCARYATDQSFLSSWAPSASDLDISNLSTKVLQSCFAYLAPHQLFPINIEKLKTLNVYALTESHIAPDTLLTVKILLEAAGIATNNKIMPLMETLLEPKYIGGPNEPRNLLGKKLVDCNTSKPEILKKILTHLYLKTGSIKKTLDKAASDEIEKDSPFFEAFLEGVKTYLANDKPSQSIKILYIKLKNKKQVVSLETWLKTSQIAITILSLCFPYGINGTDTITHLNTLLKNTLITSIEEYVTFCS